MTPRTGTIAFVGQSRDLPRLAQLAADRAPAWRIVGAEALGDPAAVDVVVSWRPAPGSLDPFTNLKLVHSIGAGADNILAYPGLPAVHVCRIVDPDLADSMAQYVLWGALHFHRQFDAMLRDQAGKTWRRVLQHPASTCTVGIMGVGVLGAHVATLLAHAGFRVSGWSRSEKSLPNVAMYHGQAQRDAFLAQVDILVCLLPLTPDTTGILDREVFDALPHGATLIHCGRGAHLDAEDLQTALRSGQLRGALVDVFPQEPLPATDPLWDAPNLIVTPHIAAVANDEAIVGQVLDNVRRLDAGLPLHAAVDPTRGY
ncbi:glyoxylate/hydroxypyruvate reductase A [Alcaligenaceae bacterium A4P071]|nr:glyoxylate/hydroxypyruvate reductase A [Alcaligenaceae bacterium A4P071]